MIDKLITGICHAIIFSFIIYNIAATIYHKHKPEEDVLPIVSSAPKTTSSLKATVTEQITYYKLDLPKDFPYSSEDFQDIVRPIAEEYNIPETTLYGLMYTESRFNPKAVSETNDVGLCQINLRYWHDYAGNTRDYFDIETNIRACCNALSAWRSALEPKLSTYSPEEQERMVLNAYNGGWSKVSNNTYASLVYKNRPDIVWLVEREITND